MKDFDICLGTGDVPSPIDEYSDSEYIKPIRYSKQDIEKKNKRIGTRFNRTLV